MAHPTNSSLQSSGGALGDTLDPRWARTLSRSFHRTALALVAIALATFVSAEQSFGLDATLTIGGSAVALLGALIHLETGRRAPLPRLVANLGVLVVLGYTFVTVFAAGQLLVGFSLMLKALLWVKLLSPKRARDWSQVYVLSLALMLIAGVMSRDAFFGIGATLFVIVAILSLFLFTLVRATERPTAPAKRKRAATQKPPRRRKPNEPEPILVVGEPRGARAAHVHRPALLGMRMVGLLALATTIIGAGMMVVFLAFPRFSTGWVPPVLPDTMRSQSGFSNEVSIGDGGTIEMDERVALYAAFDHLPSGRLHFKGAVQHLYDSRSGHWSHDPRARTFVPNTIDTTKRAVTISDKRQIQYDPNRPPRSRPMFTPGELHSRDVPNPMREPGLPPASQVYFDNTSSTLLLLAGSRGDSTVPLEQRVARMTQPIEYALRYTPSPRDHDDAAIAARFEQARPRRAHKPFPCSDAMRAEMQGFLEQYCPPDETDLASARGAGLDVDAAPAWTSARVARLERVLSEPPFEYSLTSESAPDGVDAVRHFLFTTRVGHCEYFAAAMALLLWADGVDVRLATGYAGGDDWFEHDEDGKRRWVNVVRESSAHAWLEVAYDQFGWVAYDPSPQSGAGAPPMNDFEALVAKLQFEWESQVVRFDLDDQERMAEELGALLREFVTDVKLAIQDVGDAVGDATGVAMSPIVRDVVGALVFLIPCIVLWRVMLRIRRKTKGRQPRTAKAQPSEFMPLQRVLRLLESIGVRRTPAETPMELLDREPASVLLRTEERAMLLGAYHRHRFGPTRGDVPIPPAADGSWSQLEQRLRERLKHYRKAGRAQTKA